MNAEIDARHILPTVRTPTLVLHRAGDIRITIDAGQYIANHVPGAKLVTLPGSNHVFWNERDIIDRMVDEVEEFLTGYRAESELDRVLATVLFTDIVDSTKRAAALGDRMWRAMLDRHDEIVRQLISADGLWTDNPATNFITVTFEPNNGNRPNANRLASRVARASALAVFPSAR